MLEALDFLKSHRFFCNLTNRQLESLLQYCRVLNCRRGTVLYYKNEPIDSLLLLIEGGLALGTERAFPGNALFLSGLAIAVQCDSSVIAVEDCKVIQLRREAFLRWLHAHPGVVSKLRSRKDKDWGFPVSFWKEYGPLIPYKRRRGPKYLLVLRRWWVFWLFRQLPVLLITALCIYFPAARGGLFIMIPLLAGIVWYRQVNGLFINNRSVCAKILKLRGLKRWVIKIPLEQILSIEVQRKGILRNLMKVGRLSLKTATEEGSLIIPGLFRPKRAEDQLNQLKETRRILKDPLSSLKEAWERRKTQSLVPEEIFRGSLCSPPEITHGAFRFRKSVFILLRQIFLPLAIFLLPLTAWALKFFPPQWNWILGLLSLAPALLVLYRWEDWRNDIFLVDQGKIYDIDRKPLGKEMTRRQTELGYIENITARQNGFFHWLFNAGEVKMILPGSSDDFIFEDVADPWMVQDQLLIMREQEKQRAEDAKRDQRQKELLALADLLSQELS